MAIAKAYVPTKVIKYAYPTRYGSHKCMMVGEAHAGRCVLEDEFGQYNTELSRLDNGLADPNRYSEERGVSKALRGN